MITPILLYHSIAEAVAPRYRRWAVHPARFASHLAHLRTHGYTPLTVTAFAQAMTTGSALPAKPVVLSFDDGLADFATEALPLLQQFECTATLFVTTGYVGATSRWLTPVGEGQRPMLTWAQIRDLERAGIEIGAHSHTHRQLDTLTPAQAHHEITHSKQMLEDALGRTVTAFAYPHGYHSPTVRRQVLAAGFDAACGVKHALSATTDDRFALARIIIDAETDVTQLRALLTGRGLRVAPTGERLPTTLWRALRRVLTRAQRALTLHRKEAVV